MELSRPLATVTPTLDGDVLAVLAQTDLSFTTGQVHRILTQYSQEGIRRVLQRLSKQGIVLAERVGNTFSYRLNRDHLAAGHIIGLAGLHASFLNRVAERLASWEVAPVYAAVFGSAARATMSVDSDIDVFLVRPDGAPEALWAEQVDDLMSQIVRWTGNDARALQFTASELADSGEPILRDVLATGLTVAGKRSWLNGRRQAGGAS